MPSAIREQAVTHCFQETAALGLWNGCGFSVHENLLARGSVVTRHRHELAYVSLQVSGSCVERSGSRELACAAGSASFHPPCEEHDLVVGERELRCLSIEIQSDLIARLREGRGRDPRFLHDRCGPLVWLTARIHEEVTSWSASSPLIVEGLVLEILGFVSKTQDETRIQPRWMILLEEMLRAEFRRGWTVAELAERMGVHPVNLSRTWRRFRGCSLGESLNRLRIEEACRRIAAGSISLADVALEVGFGDQTHFSRVFKQVTGTTPGAFRSAFARRG